MSGRRHAFLGPILSAAVVSTVSASSDPFTPFANCRKIVEEKDYTAAGGKLVETQRADLAKFPKGFLGVVCEGAFSLEGVVQEDGAVLISGTNHVVTCDGELESHSLKALDKSIWRGTVIDQRFQTLHFEPPGIADKPVCVRIHRIWLPDTPHRFWAPKELSKRK